MSEIQNNSDAISEQGFFSKLASGDFGLAKTYWVFGVLVGMAISFLSSIVGVFFSLGAIYLLNLLHTIYFIPVALGTWRAADMYSGNKIWAVLAKIAIVLGVISLTLSWVMVFAYMSI